MICWKGEHLRYAIVAGVFALLYPLGLPLFLLRLLLRMQRPGAKEKFKFLGSLHVRSGPRPLHPELS